MAHKSTLPFVLAGLVVLVLVLLTWWMLDTGPRQEVAEPDRFERVSGDEPQPVEKASPLRPLGRSGQPEVPSAAGDPGPGPDPVAPRPGYGQGLARLIDLVNSGTPEEILEEFCAQVESLPDNHAPGDLDTVFEPYPESDLRIPPLAFVEVEHWWLPLPEGDYEVLVFKAETPGAADIVLRSREIAVWVKSKGFGGIKMGDGQKLVDVCHEGYSMRHADFVCDRNDPVGTVRKGQALAVKPILSAGGRAGWKRRAFAGVGVVGSILTWSEPPEDQEADPGACLVEQLFQIDDKNWSVLFAPLRADAIGLARALPAYVRTSPGKSRFPVPSWMPLVLGLPRGDAGAVRALMDRRDVPWALGTEKVLQRLQVQ